jgi:hypothetical protein
MSGCHSCFSFLSFSGLAEAVISKRLLSPIDKAHDQGCVVNPSLVAVGESTRFHRIQQISSSSNNLATMASSHYTVEESRIENAFAG